MGKGRRLRRKLTTRLGESRRLGELRGLAIRAVVGVGDGVIRFVKVTMVFTPRPIEFPTSYCSSAQNPIDPTTTQG